VASVTGTEQDPQVRSRQVATLRAAGVVVMDSNAQAARLAALIAERVAGGGP
jgi:FdrA protein